MPIQITIKNDLKWLREKYGLTQSEVAEVVGISRAAYNRIEKGKALPSLLTFIKLSELLIDHEGYETHRYGILEVSSEL